jgi:predicted amidophosphoribosyltransferase
MELMKRKIRHRSENSFVLYHLAYYYAGDLTHDIMARLIIDFKKGDEAAIRYFIAKSIWYLSKQRMKRTMVIVRTLGHSEIGPAHNAGSPVNRLAISLSAVFGCRYIPELIMKTRRTKPMKTLTFADRQVEQKDCYRIKKGIVDLNRKNVLIVDDVVTTGATAQSVIDAILKAYPKARVVVFALAWTPPRWQQYYLQAEDSIHAFSDSKAL